jgi:uncharacterized protein (DUF1810 family)
MKTAGDPVKRDDPFDLHRFTSAQAGIYTQALAELNSGQKRTHWMWFIFPQIDGLGFSPTSKYYAIKSLEEARQYLDHPVLGARLLECTDAVLAFEGRSIADIFGYPDDLKLKSCMTLFSSVASEESETDQPSVFFRVLEKYFHGERDARTLALLDQLKGI